MILRNYTFEKLIGDYVILRQGKDSSGATRAFIEGWEAYKYRDWDKARRYFEEALRLGGPSGDITPLLAKAEKEAKEKSCEMFLCTEKDWVKLADSYKGSLPCAYVKISLQLLIGEEEWGDLLARLGARV